MAWLNGWSFRQAITIGSSVAGLSADVSNLAISVHVPSSNASFWLHVQAGGNDVRFTAADGSTLLNYEIESFDNVGDDAWYHVKVPTLTAAANTTIYLYYGNASAAAGENRTGTWDADYSAVWHLNQDSAIGAFSDSTANAQNGTNTGTTDVVAQEDKGRHFAAASLQYIGFANNALLAPQASAFAIEVGIKTSSAATQYIFFDAGTNTNTHVALAIAATTGKLYAALRDGTNLVSATGVAAVNNGAWRHVVLVRNGTTINVYVDGVLDVTATNALLGTVDTSVAGTAVPQIGAWFDGTTRNNYFDGDMDEMTISKGAVARSLDWVKARFKSFQGTWLTFGAEQQLNVAEIMVGGAVIGGASDAVKGFALVMGGGGFAGGFADYLFQGGGYYWMTGGAVAGGTSSAAKGIALVADGGAIAGGVTAYNFTTTALYIPIIWLLLDAANAPISGGTLQTALKIRRNSDGVIFDWNDGAFKAAGWVAVSTSMGELDAVNFPGYYKKEVNVATWEDGWYLVAVDYTGTVRQGGSLEMLIMGGRPVDYRLGSFIDSAISTRASAADYTASRAQKLENMDASISSRLASSSYTSPDNTGIAAIKAKTDGLPYGIRKNAALNNFQLLMVDATDNKTGKTGLAVEASRAIDGSGFSPCANTVLEVGGGIYKIDLAASDLNGDVITFKFSAMGANDRFITVKTNI